MYHSYLPTNTPEKSGRRLDQSHINNLEKCTSIMCGQLAKFKEQGGKFFYDGVKVSDMVIVGKLRRHFMAMSQLGKEMTVLQIEDQTGSLNIQIYRNQGLQDLLTILLNLNQLETINDLVGSYVRIVFNSKRPVIKTKPVSNTCISIQLVTDMNLLTQHRMQVIRDYCKNKYG